MSVFAVVIIFFPPRVFNPILVSLTESRGGWPSMESHGSTPNNPSSPPFEEEPETWQGHDGLWRWKMETHEPQRDGFRMWGCRILTSFIWQEDDIV